MQRNEDGNAAPGPDLTPPDEPKIEPTPAEKLAGELAGVFDNAGELGIDLDKGFERVAGYIANLGGWNRNRNPNLFAMLERAHSRDDHLAMLDAAHEIAEGAKSRASASAKVWEVIKPLLKAVFLSALV